MLVLVFQLTEILDLHSSYGYLIEWADFHNTGCVSIYRARLFERAFYLQIFVVMPDTVRFRSVIYLLPGY